MRALRTRPGAGRFRQILIGFWMTVVASGCYRPVEFSARTFRADSGRRIDAGPPDAGSLLEREAGPALDASDLHGDAAALGDSGSMAGADASNAFDARIPGFADASVRADASIACEPRPLDLLLVLDTSPSMRAVQTEFIAELSTLLRPLTVPLDRYPGPVAGLHVALITTDLGNAGAPEAGCSSLVGDDGLMSPRFARTSGCDRVEPSEAYATQRSGISELASDARCLIEHAGASGCTRTQPLEALLKALSPATPPIFQFGTGGHGQDANLGFLRPGSVLAVLMITNHDDCSHGPLGDHQDGGVRGPAPPTCIESDPALHALTRYLEGFARLRGADDLVLSIMGGVPESLVDLPLNELRAHPALEPTSTDVACSGALGAALAPRRLLEFASTLGDERASVESVCAATLRAGLARIADRFATAACL